MICLVSVFEKSFENIICMLGKKIYVKERLVILYKVFVRNRFLKIIEIIVKLWGLLFLEVS